MYQLDVEKKTYQYPWQINVVMRFFTRFILFLAVVLSIYNVVYPWPKSTEDWGHTFEVLIFFVLLIVVAMSVYHTYSDIKVNTDGLWVGSILREVFIPWEDIVLVYKTPYPHPFPQIWFVRTKGNHLPFIYRLPSLLYMHSWNPHIPIVYLISNEKELISIIRKNMGKRNVEP